MSERHPLFTGFAVSFFVVFSAGLGVVFAVWKYMDRLESRYHAGVA